MLTRDEEFAEAIPNNGTNFNLDQLLHRGECEGAAASSFGKMSSDLYNKGSYRRRRTTASHAIETNGISSKGRYRDVDDDRSPSYPRGYNSASDALIKKLTVPFIMLIVLVFWGPLLLQSNQSQRFMRPRTRTLLNIGDARVDDLNMNENAEGDSEEEVQSNDAWDSQNEQIDSLHGDKKLSAPVLKALEAVRRANFELPPREQGDDKYSNVNLSDNEQKDRSINAQPRRQMPKGESGQIGEALNHKIVSPIEQYQLRTQEEEKEQLRRYEQQKLHGQAAGFQIDQIAIHEEELLQKEKELAQQLWQQKQDELQQQQRLQQIELQHQVQLQQKQLELDKLELEKLQKENKELEKLTLENRRAVHVPLANAEQRNRPQITKEGPSAAQGAFVPKKMEELRRQPPIQPKFVPAIQAILKTELVFAYKHADHQELIPEHFESSLANVWDPIQPTDTALFFHIPKSGGTTVADILTHCLDLVSASSIGASEGHGTETILEVRRYNDKGRYVNVNPASIDGIRHAKELGLARSGLADLVVLHRLHEGSELFDPRNKGRLFCMFRNPVHRAISMFYYLQKATWEPTYDPSLASMTLLEYANSNKVEENWITRFLVHQYTGRLSKDAVSQAKAIMRNKMIVGILGNFQESLKRFELYFDWWADNKKSGNAAQMVQCQQNQARAKQNKVAHPMPDENDPAFKRLLQLNWADMELYLYAVQLFQEQAELVRHKDASLM